jgi:hypothetical protein
MRLAVGFLAASLLLQGLSTPALAVADPPLAGRTLEDALGALAQRGLKLVYTSYVVRPEMRVDREPAADGPREVLDELLAPHGLVAREGPGGVLTVLPATPDAGIRGTVRERRSRRPLPGVSVRLLGNGHETVTGGDGTFEIAGVAAGTHTLEAGRSGYLSQETEVRLEPGRVRELLVELVPVPLESDSINVTSNRPGLLGESLSSLALERETLLSLPNVGEDVVRPVTLLPGTAGNDFSARFNVRGGRRDEVMVRLDGFEVLEPYHLRDVDSALSILSPDAIDSAELLTGGFPAEYGDRMGGVLDLTTVDPSWRRRSELAMNVVNARASGSGTLANDRGRWLASARGGLLQLAAQLAEQEEEPRFWDAFGKLDYELRPGHSLRFNVLASQDRFDFHESGAFDPAADGEIDPGNGSQLQQFRTSYRSDYVWLAHHAVSDSDRYFETRLGVARVEADRRGGGQEEGGLALADRRHYEVGSLAHEWSFLVARRHDLKWGLEARALDADYDYLNGRRPSELLAGLNDPPRTSTTSFRQGFQGEQYGVYLADRFEAGPRLAVELGLRFDRNTALDDNHHLSPRSSLSWAVGERSRLRAAWGLFHQTQRLYELQVEDGETHFQPAERAEHRIVGFEHEFGARDRRPFVLRAEVYERRIRDPRVRFENLFDPLSLVPELENDRIRIAPESGRAQGLELFLGGRAAGRVDWFVSYTRSRVEDRIGGRWVPGSVDQPHKLSFDVAYRTRNGWAFNLAWEAHTGWPTTAVGVRRTDGDPGFELELGPFFGARLPDYSRLDLHVSRSWRLARGELVFYVDVQNFTNAENIRGFEVALASDDGRAEVIRGEKLWGPLLPSLGLRWSF